MRFNHINSVSKKSRIRRFLFWFAIVGVDLFVFLILGLLQMGYDDAFDESKGAYWSFASMNATEKLISICSFGWFVVNVMGIVYLGFRIYKRWKKKRF